MSSYIMICVVIMAICTYLPRMLPLTFFRKKIQSTFVLSLLYYVPYAVISALTFPSIFYATGHIMSAFVACLVAIYFAYQGKGLIFVAMMAIISAYVVNVFLI